MPNTDLIKFIKNQDFAQTNPQDLKQKLLKVGWLEKDIDEALTLKDIPLPDHQMPVKTQNSQNTMFYAFQHILMFLTMGVYTFSLNALLHVYIDKYISGTSTGIFGSYSFTNTDHTYVRGLISSIFVSFPLFILLFLKTTKERLGNSELKLLKSRAILTYITLVITFVVMLFNVIKVIYSVLEGSVSLAIFLHFLVPVIICGSIFWYFLREILDRRHI